jgi:mono/diheme cytochrome c family protein
MRPALATVLLLACAESAPPADAPTWHADVAPLVERHCAACHATGELADPIAFDDYEATARWGVAIQHAVVSGDMPPFKARETDACTPDDPWMNDARLSADEIATFAAWVDADMPEGDPADAPEPEPAPSVDLADTTPLLPTSAYVVPPADVDKDVFTCVSLDPGLVEDGWLEGYQVLPDERRVVHHVLVAIDEDGETAGLADADGRYDCLGGFGVDAQFVGAWVPGAAPMPVPDGSAVRVPAGARILLQMHYHLVDEPVPDATGVGIRWADDAPDRPAVFGLYGNARGLQPDPDDGGLARLYIPAGSTDHEEHLVIPWRQPQPLRVFLVGNHMHYVGTRMRVWIERPATDGSSTCILDTPDWDFDWQQTYFYDAAAGEGPLLQAGDEQHIACTYDNSLTNPAVAGALTEAGLTAPVDVSLGEGSLDEMCLVTLGAIPEGELVAPEPTHLGTATLSLATADGTSEDSCDAPAEALVDLDGGVLLGQASCEVFAYGQTRTLEATWLSRDAALGDVGGAGQFDLSDFATGPFTWTGTLSEEALELQMSATYPLQPDLTVEATVRLTP